MTNLTALQLSQILSRLQQLRERISAAENLVALELDHRRNQLFTFRVVRKDTFLKHSIADSYLSTQSARSCPHTGSLHVCRTIAAFAHALATGTPAATTCDGLHSSESHDAAGYHCYYQCCVFYCSCWLCHGHESPFQCGRDSLGKSAELHCTSRSSTACHELLVALHDL